MFSILDNTQLAEQDLTIKQQLRILKSRKKYAVICMDNLYLVNDLERLFFDRLRAENIYNALVYEIN